MACVVTFGKGKVAAQLAAARLAEPAGHVLPDWGAIQQVACAMWKCRRAVQARMRRDAVAALRQGVNGFRPAVTL